MKAGRGGRMSVRQDPSPAAGAGAFPGLIPALYATLEAPAAAAHLSAQDAALLLPRGVPPMHPRTTQPSLFPQHVFPPSTPDRRLTFLQTSFRRTNGPSNCSSASAWAP